VRRTKYGVLLMGAFLIVTVGPVWAAPTGCIQSPTLASPVSDSETSALSPDMAMGTVSALSASQPWSQETDETTRRALTYFTLSNTIEPTACSAAVLAEPVTWAEWIVLLYGSIYETPQDKPWFVNDAAYYTDVLPTHWAYLAIEALRLKQAIVTEWVSPEGNLFPDTPRSLRDMLFMLGLTLTPEATQQPDDWTGAEILLSEYHIQPTVFSLEGLQAMGRVLALGFGPLVSPNKDVPPDLTRLVSRREAIRLAYYRHLITLQKAAVLSDADLRLPEGLSLSISPTAVVFLERLEVGGPVYFVLQRPLELPATATAPGVVFPVGSRVFARVVSLTMPNKEASGAAASPMARLMLEQLVPPSGVKYTVNANLVLLFPVEEPRWFLPTAQFETVTKRVERLLKTP
jgi:hypothetical protein